MSKGKRYNELTCLLYYKVMPPNGLWGLCRKQSA